ncbi:hypothetical protein P3W24_04170 [Luteibacter sp. PPL201]|uniref:Uncharacterized protein n=1 Tax=Luteibacter sahnii TaxID=3021977 RepID=A0ABT6B7V3_9GAMM|nr:hypothetical protein [Luteibacter sp. PPL193]MDY1547932.1 hypothetical protein [Luteibacter sp. PPL193]
MRSSLSDYLPWIAIVLAVIVTAVYLDTRSKSTLKPETYESCMARLTATNEGDADRSLNRSICANKPRESAGEAPSP